MLCPVTFRVVLECAVSLTDVVTGCGYDQEQIWDI
jgi:hypothetical protein